MIAQTLNTVLDPRRVAALEVLSEGPMKGEMIQESSSRRHCFRRR